VFLGSSREDPEQEDKLIGRFADQVAGLILVSSRLPEARIRHHAQRRLIVLVNRDIAGLPRVLIDSGRGVAEAVDHLAALGHRRLAYLGGPAQSWSDQQRREAVGAAARRHGLAVDLLAADLPTHEAGRAAAAALRATGATAVIAFDDLLAQGVMAGLSELGLRVPEDISVIGCDDVLGAATWPPLTTVSNRSAEAGRSALGMLVDLVTGGTPRDRRAVLDTGLVVRRSTAAPGSAPKGADGSGKAERQATR
jgi:LacI family transcriptional regulator